jgi:hypothetical protein
MKKLITAGALVIMLASPAFAQKSRPNVNTQPTQAEIDNGVAGGRNGEVVWGTKVRGQDPDPFIRGSIVRGLGNYGGD